MLIARTVVGALIAASVSLPALAIITIRDPGRNLAPPLGDLANSGWQYEGDWHGFTGTVIGSRHFITAAHVGGYPGESFLYRGRTYHALDASIMPGTDICVWTVLERMPDWAPIYVGNSEIAHDVMLFGRGTSRGKPIYGLGVRRGWYWGASDGRLSWGKSWISAVMARDTDRGQIPILGDALLAPFDADVGLDAGTVSGGDSGGGVFLKDDDGVWKLCGVIYGVDKGYLPTARAAAPVNAAIYDGRGLYHLLPGGMRGVLAQTSTNVLPSQTIISRISTSLPAIRKAVNSKSQIWTFAVYVFGLVCLPILAVILLIWLGVRRQSRINATHEPDAGSGTPQ